MGLNLDPFGGGPLESWSFTGCAILTWLASLTGTIYLGLSLLTLCKVLKWVNFWDSSSVVLKEPAIFSLCEPIFLKEVKSGSFLRLLADGPERRPLPVFLWGVLKGVSDCAFLAMVLKDSDEWSWKDSDLPLRFLSHGLPSIFSWWYWKESLELVFSPFSMAEMDLETFLHNTWMRPDLTHWMSNNDFFLSLGLYDIKNMVLKGLFQVVLKFQFDAAMIYYQPPIILTFKVDLGSF